MSRESIVAKRYARALFELAHEKGQGAQTERELKLVVETIDSDKELQAFLKHPGVPAEAKTSLLEKAFAGQVSEQVMGTLRLLMDKGRESLPAALYTAYVKIAGEKLDLADAVVTSAFPLTEEEQREVSEKFSRITGKTIRIENVIDKSLIGGIQVRIGDRLYDGSLSGKLARLEQSLKQAQAL
ncbi:ATP synthase F0F1 subunit delta [Paenibacillus swuensis]|uniref:ATP synthase subunit delta n=1 Tax=Paenibacillus swuensis TaxID=1178515 RepID=A0A172TID7_9BACL|nr:F0F1 ATP synthase subunit delta [Paenibacillus swuensis]ANE46664.1 ATP synthase F0F1 subunit delta [Paenibacillus swuensis]